MLVVKELLDLPLFPSPLGLLLGNFDGVHLGHLALIKKLREKVGKSGTIALLSFSNHPSTVFGKEISVITPLEEKLILLDKAGVNVVILLKFTEDLALKKYDLFLKEVRDYYPFTYFLRGKGSSFGYKKGGTEENVKKCAKEMGFKATYIPLCEIEGIPVSSQQIRVFIENKDFKKAELLLGRKLTFHKF